MKDAFEVLYHKEAEIARVRREIESLNLVASILAEDSLSYFRPDSELEGQEKKPAQAVAAQEGTGTDGQPSPAPRARFWESWKQKRR